MDEDNGRDAPSISDVCRKYAARERLTEEEQRIFDDYMATFPPSFDEDEDCELGEHDFRKQGRDEYGLLIHFDGLDWRKIARSRGFPGWSNIQLLIDAGVPSFPIDRDVWVTGCARCHQRVYVPLDQLGAPAKVLLAGTPSVIRCIECHRRAEWEESHPDSFKLARDQQNWEESNSAYDDLDVEPEPEPDEAEAYRNRLRLELEWEHGPIGCRSRGFPTWEALHDLVGDDIAGGPLVRRTHIGQCFTCRTTIVAPVKDLRSSIEDRLEPTDTIIRCFACHQSRAWENQGISVDEMVEREERFVTTLGKLVGELIEDDRDDADDHFGNA